MKKKIQLVTRTNKGNLIVVRELEIEAYSDEDALSHARDILSQLVKLQ